jgi:hypothetical protein
VFLNISLRMYITHPQPNPTYDMMNPSLAESNSWVPPNIPLVCVLQGQRRIDFDGFLSALFRIAEKKGQALEEVVSHILNAGGPTVKCTKTDYVKFHDDKSTYTGVYSRGGPTNVDPSKDLSSLLDRSEADVRGVKKRGSYTGGEGLLSKGSTPSRQGSGMSQISTESRGNSDVFSSSRPSSRRESYAGEPV